MQTIDAKKKKKEASRVVFVPFKPNLQQLLDQNHAKMKRQQQQ